MHNQYQHCCRDSEDYQRRIHHNVHWWWRQSLHLWDVAERKAPLLYMKNTNFTWKCSKRFHFMLISIHASWRVFSKLIHDMHFSPLYNHVFHFKFYTSQKKKNNLHPQKISVYLNCNLNYSMCKNDVGWVQCVQKLF